MPLADSIIQDWWSSIQVDGSERRDLATSSPSYSGQFGNTEIKWVLMDQA